MKNIKIDLKYDGPNIIWYDAMLKILKNKYPERYDTICEWNNQKIAGPYKNMFITTKEIFFEYCNWIFPILLDLHKEFENYTYKNAHEKRNIGWLGEMLTQCYFWNLSKDYPCEKLKIIRTC